MNKSPFSAEEVAAVYYLHDIEKLDWSDISKRLDNNRTANSCKNVYDNVVVEKLKSCPESASKYKELYYSIHGKDLTT